MTPPQVESSGIVDSEESEKAGDDPPPGLQDLSESVLGLTKSGDGPATRPDLQLGPEDQPHLSIGRHTEIGAEPLLGVGPFSQVAEPSSAALDRSTEFGEAWNEGSGGYAEISDYADPRAAGGRAPFAGTLGRFVKLGRRYGGANGGRFAGYGAAWPSESRQLELREMEDTIPERLERDGRKRTALLDRCVE